MAIVEDQISFARVEDGEDGRGIKGTPVSTYAQSTSGTTPPTTWSDTRPNVPAGQYLWTRVVTTYTDDTTSETQTPTLMGKEGTPGLGIKSKSISYAIGTSGNTPPTSGWQETIPTVSANQYLWTKTTLVYTDESKTDAYSVGKMGANGADAKLLYLTASAENMAFNADDTPKTTQTINISAKLQNVTGTATFTATPYIGNTAQPAITLGGSGNTRTLTSAQWTNKNWTLIAVTATLDNLNDTLSIVKVKDGAKGDKGSDGIAGKDGVGVSDTTITYAQSSNGTNPPSTGWTASVPTLIKGQYLWTKTVWSYTDSTTEIGYTVSYNAKDGNDGDDGIAGKDGVGISATKIEYVGSTSGTVKPTTGWSTTIPAVAEGQYLWTRTTWTYTDNTSEMGYSAAKMGAKGAKGDQGATGPKGDQGNQGIQGPTGADGKPSYTHWAYAMDALGKNNFSTDGGDFTKWSSRVIGNFIRDSEVTISSWDNDILQSSTTVSGKRFYLGGTANLQELPQTISVEARGDKEGLFTFGPWTDISVNNKVTTEWQTFTHNPQKSGALSFYLNTSGVNFEFRNATAVVNYKFAGSYVDDQPTDSEDPTKYTWQRILGDDGKDGEKGDKGDTGSKGDKGDTGSKGDNGVSVTGTQVQYVQSSSMTEPTTGWSNTRPTPVPGQWLWTRSRNTFSDGTYGAWATVPTLIGREAIVISATAPSNPSTGTLWQTPTDPNVQKWNGTKWENWGIAPENIVADNLVVKDGRFEKLVGAELESGTITNSFDFWDGSLVPNTSAQMWRRGKTTIKNAEVTTLWEDYNKSTGAKVKEGGVIHDSDGTSVYINDPSNFNQTASYRSSGILLRDSRVPSNVSGSFLSYNDLLIYPATPIPAASGWSAYATSGANQPMAVRYGRSVRLTGAFKNNTTLPNTNETYKIGTLPVGLRPSTQEKWLAKGAGTTIFQITVDTNGDIFVNYRLGWTGSTFGYLTNNSGDIFNIAGGFAAADI